MTVTIKLFARCRDLAGADSATIDVPADCRVSDLRVELARRLPVLKELLPKCALAVNEDFAQNDTAIAQGDELALIPPVSGG